MSHFLKQGNSYNVFAHDSLDLASHLPAKNFVVKMDRNESLYLEQVDEFNITGKLYGDVSRNATRILNTFDHRPNATGVMLSGEKGSGKTLLSKLISIEGAKLGYPTVIINQPWKGDEFNTLIQTINQPAIVLFDEFEKVYDKDDQEEILTLLDGVFPSKKLFILTCNDKWRVDIHMRNRPGRIFYMLDFSGLDHDFIREYCIDNLNNQEYIETICKISSLFDQFNFDMLKALIEEMNRYNESPQDSMKMLNTKPEFSDKGKFNIKIEIEGVTLERDRLTDTVWEGNPLNDSIRIWCADRKDNEGEWDWNSVKFNSNDIVNVDPTNKLFEYVNSRGIKLELKRAQEKTFNYYNAF